MLKKDFFDKLSGALRGAAETVEKQIWQIRKNRRWRYSDEETCEELKVLLDFFQKIAGLEGA